MVAVAEGDVTRPEVEKYLDAQLSEGALGYRRIFDGSGGTTSMGPEDLMALGVRIRSMHSIGASGPLAVVVPPDKERLLERVFGMLAVANRPMRIFNEVPRAHRWIEKQNAASENPSPKASP